MWGLSRGMVVGGKAMMVGHYMSHQEESQDSIYLSCCAVTAARMMLTDALEERSARLDISEQELFENTINLRRKQYDMMVVTSIRTFRIPKAFYIFRTALL